VGKRLPAHATGLGKVLLAALPPGELEQRLEGATLSGYTTRTITDRARLLDRLETVRVDGFAVDDQEYTPGLRCVAVPVRDHRDEVVAALSASVPLMRAHISPSWKALMLVAGASLRIAERMGAPTEDARLRRLTTPGHAKVAIARAFPDPGARAQGSRVTVADRLTSGPVTS
jgi:DNA-binding IclR family transcriptional regulator